MSKGKRDYRGEYRRRIARGAAKGTSRSQARGHPKPKEAAVSSKHPPKPIEDERLQLAFRVLRQEKSLAAAARAAKVSPERLRRYATQRDIIERQGRRWTVRHDLPRRMKLFSEGKSLQIVVGDFDSASKIGRFMSAVGEFLRTNNPGGLREFEGGSVTDVTGQVHPFETRPMPSTVSHRLTIRALSTSTASLFEGTWP